MVLAYILAAFIKIQNMAFGCFLGCWFDCDGV